MAGYIKLNETEIYLENIYVRYRNGKRRAIAFVWNGTLYLMSEFEPVDRSRGCCYRFPEFIDRIQCDEHGAPLLLEMVGDIAVNLYREEYR